MQPITNSIVLANEYPGSWATARECSSTGSFLGMKKNPLLSVARIRFHLWNGGVPVVEQMRGEMFSYGKLFWHEKKSPDQRS